VQEISLRLPQFCSSALSVKAILTQNTRMSSTLTVTSSDQANTSEALARVLAASADERKGGEITVLHVAEVSYLADYFVFVTAFSKPQVRAIAGLMQASAGEQLNRQPRRIEGMSDASWVLLDFGDVIAHILLPREREYYNLEAFWGHAERLMLPPTGPA
jgi:ribosome-associated protein